MAFSVSTKRSKTQDSPTFWLSLIAGSLALHLVLLLFGRWYFSQTASAPAGIAQTPLDFVEIDPNAPPLRQPIAPSNTPTQTELPKAAPPQDAVTETTQAPNTIANLPRQAAPERPRTIPSPSPNAPPVSQPNRTTPSSPQTIPQPGQLPSNRPTTNPTNPARPTTPPGGTNSTPGSSTPGTSTPGTTPSPGSSIPAQPGSPNSPATPETPNNPNAGNPSQGNPSSPIGGGTPITASTSVQGEVFGALQETSFRPEQYARGAVTLRSAKLPNITLEYSSKLPESVLDLRLGLLINAEGQVVETDVRDDSPTLEQNPKLSDPTSPEAIQARAEIKSIVDPLIFQANAEGSLAFDVNLESEGASKTAYRIINIRITVGQ